MAMYVKEPEGIQEMVGLPRLIPKGSRIHQVPEHRRFAHLATGAL